MYEHRTIKTEAELLQAGLDVLGTHGIRATVGKRPHRRRKTGEDAVVRLAFGRRMVPYHVIIKRWLTPATLGHVATQLGAIPQPALLVTDYVALGVAERLRDLEIAFVDAAGNAYLDRPPVLIWVVGRKPPVATRRPRAARAFQPGGLKLLFALLCQPDLIARPTRTIAKHAGVANGTVGRVLQELRQEGYLVDLRQRGVRRRLRNLKRLLNHWTEAFARTLRPNLLIGRYKAPEPNWWRTVNLQECGGVIGGEAAEAVLTSTLRPGVVTVYLPRPPGRFILDNRLITGADGTVELRERFWGFEYAWDRPTLAPPLLIYADLLATGDARCLEAAQRVYEAHLTRLIDAE
jgi:hypothetical protein